MLFLEQRTHRVPFARAGDTGVKQHEVDNDIITSCGYACLRVVRRSLSIFLLLALFCAPRALAQSAQTSLLMPGVTFTKRVQFTANGPVVLDVVTAPKPGGLYSLSPVLSNETIVGREKLTDMEKRLSSSATTVGVNGDLFDTSDGHPSGVLIRTGVLEHPPEPDRTSVGIGADGTIHTDRVTMLGFWRATGQRLRIGLNDPPNENGYALFTHAYGPTTPAADNASEVVFQQFPTITPNKDLVGVVTSIAPSTTGKTPIPPQGAVIQATGVNAFGFPAEAPVGASVTVRYTLNPSWDGIASAIGGGPLIVSGGKAVFRADEAFTSAQLSSHGPRTAIGQRADGKILLVTVDGDQPGYSAGMTNLDLALALQQLGAVTASALDSGASTTMAFDGQLLNRPSTGKELAVSDALVVGYTGVYVPPMPAPVISPNGDGVAEAETLSYRLVRPATVQASLVGPDGTVIPIDSGARPPGTYRFTWSGITPTMTPATEGLWHFAVTATDDLNQVSQADRTFALDDTLGGLDVRPTALKLTKKRTRLVASFTLAHPAQIAATVETAGGVVVRVLARKSFAAGRRTVAWNGYTGSGTLAYGGSYRVHVAATNDLGRVDLSTAFTARR
jgi:exopolysaccharide biosynthesis protein